MSCPYCEHYILYKLKDGNYKCARCKKKFSPKKVQRKAKILKGFLDELNTKQISEKYNISYVTTSKEINKIRNKIINICEEEFLKKQDITEFEEYLYIPKSKKNNKNSIYHAQNFLSINYSGKIYNILLSDMQAYNNLTPSEINSTFTQSKIIKLKTTKIMDFWEYFEHFITKFKGIKKENFFLYLKEAEFRFNNFKIEVKDLF